jgi:hypothetical protein
MRNRRVERPALPPVKDNRPVSASFTVIALASRDHGDVAKWQAGLLRAIEATGRTAEIVGAIGDRCPGIHAALEAGRNRGTPLEIVTLHHWYDETVAVQAALRVASAPAIVTLGVGTTVDGRQLGDLLAALDRADLAVLASRRPVPLADRLARRLFGVPLAAPAHRLRAFRRSALERVADRSVAFPLLPLYAGWQGLRLAEVEPDDLPPRSGRWRTVIDGLSVMFLFVLLDFAKRPLRLFGLAGTLAFLVGLAITLPPVAARLLHGEALADDPALLPGLLLTALGLQSGIIGLVAELLVFMRSRALGDGAGGRIAG